MTQYFICSAGEPGKEYDTENLGKCILDSSFYLHTGSKQKGPIDGIEPDDILILKYRNRFIAYGRVESAVEYGEGKDWNIRVRVAGWITGKSASTYGIKAAQVEGSNFATVREVDREFARARISEIGVPF